MGFLKKIIRLFSALNSNVSKTQLAAGFACGLLLALVPAGNLLWVALYLLLSFFKLNSGAMLLTMAVLKLVYRPFAPLLDGIGWAILDAPSLESFFTGLYNVPVLPFTRFNNSLVMGGLALGLAAWIPVFLLCLFLVTLYRSKLAPLVKKSRLYKAFTKLPLIQKLVSMGGKAAEMSGIGG